MPYHSEDLAASNGLDRQAADVTDRPLNAGSPPEGEQGVSRATKKALRSIDERPAPLEPAKRLELLTCGLRITLGLSTASAHHHRSYTALPLVHCVRYTHPVLPQFLENSSKIDCLSRHDAGLQEFLACHKSDSRRQRESCSNLSPQCLPITRPEPGAPDDTANLWLASSKTSPAVTRCQVSGVHGNEAGSDCRLGASHSGRKPGCPNSIR